jgi:hypothetical protein
LASTAPLLFTGCQRDKQLTQVESGQHAGAEKQPEAVSEIEQALQAETARAIAVVEKLGATVVIGEQNPGQPVEIIDLSFKEVTDVEMAQLKTFTRLEELYLIETAITDAGLAGVHGLANLRTLDIGRTRVTDKGLVHLHGLMNLKTLGLSSTRITDAGIRHLTGLTGLQLLDLSNTKITGAGIRELHQALPNIQVLH